MTFDPRDWNDPDEVKTLAFGVTIAFLVVLIFILLP